jgi:hypothetical protein
VPAVSSSTSQTAASQRLAACLRRAEPGVAQRYLPGDRGPVQPENPGDLRLVQVEDALGAHPRAVEPGQVAAGDPDRLGGGLHEPRRLLQPAVLEHQRVGDHRAHQVEPPGDPGAAQPDRRRLAGLRAAGPEQ